MPRPLTVNSAGWLATILAAAIREFAERTPGGASEMLKLTVKVSLPSTVSSSCVSMVKLCDSPAVPAKVSTIVGAV